MALLLERLGDAEAWISDDKVGKKLRQFYQKDNPNNTLYHIRAVVDDHLVLRYYRSGRGWKYLCESYIWVYTMSEHLTLE